MRKKSFFLIGMTSILLAFAMIGCDNGTSNGGGNTPTYPYSPTQPVNPVTADKEADLYKALENGDPVTVYVLAEIPLSKPLDLKEDQHIVVAKSAPNGSNVVQSAGGPLFDITATGNVALNIGAKLTLEHGSSLTVAGGAAVTVTPPSGITTLTDVLHVQSGAKVSVGFAPVGNAVQAGAHLTVNTFANVRFDDGAILAVAAAPGTVTLADKDSGIALLPGSRLAVVAEGGVNSSDPIGTNANSSVIVVPTGGSSATIAIDEVYTDAGAITPAPDELIENFESAKAAINANSTTPTTDAASAVQTLLNKTEVTKVTYTGNTKVPAISAAGKTLVIAGTITGQDAAISVGTLEITATGKLTTSEAITVDTLTNSGELKINDVVKAITVATLVNDGTLDLGTGGTLAGNGTVTNTGTIKIPAPSISALNGVLAAKGTIVATKAITVTADATLTVPADTELEITGALTVGAFKLTVAAVPATSSISFGTIANGGTIAVADAATLLVILGEVTDGNVEVSDSLTIGTAEVQESAVLKIASGKTLTVTGELEVTSSAPVTGAANTSRIVVQGSGTITGAENFVYSNGTTAIETPIPAGTYTWDGTSSKWKGEANEPSVPGGPATEINAATPEEVVWDEYIETVNYTGTDALTGITVPNGKALIITNEANITNQTAAINKTGSGTITNNGTINTATNSADVLANLVGIPTTGTGKVVLKGAVEGVEAPLALGANLEIDDGGIITFTNPGSGTAAFSATSNKTVTILSDNDATALPLPAGITGYGDNVEVINEGTHDTAAISTATVSITALGAILAAKGPITATETIAVGSVGAADGSAALDVPDNTALTINALTVNNADSILTVTLGPTASTLTITSNITTNDGTIKTSNSTVLATLLSKVTAGTIEVTGTSASLAGGTVAATLKVSGTLTLSGTLTNNGTIDLGATGSISPYSSVANTNGTIKTSQVDKVTALFTSETGIAEGTVEITEDVILAANTTIPSGVTLTVPNGKMLTVNETLTATAGYITNNGTIVLGTSGSITPYSKVTSGTIKPNNDAQLAALLTTGTGIVGGTIEITTANAVLSTATTIKAGVTLTVPNGKTLTLGNGGAVTLTLTNSSSKLILEAGGKVNAANALSTISTTGTLTVTVAGTNNKGLLSGTQLGGWVITQNASPTAGTAIVGDLSLAVAETTGVITPTQLSSTGSAIGSLEAGTGTTITFAGGA